MNITKQKFLVLTILSLPIIFSSCIFTPTIKGNGNVVEETREIEPFDEIKASRGINLYITQDENIKLTIRADENLIEVIETEVVGGELIVRSTKNVKNAKSFKVFVSTPKINSIKGSSGCNVYSETELVSDNFDVSASSGCNIHLSVQTEEIEASSSSGSNIILDGITSEFRGRASSGSNIKAEDLKSKNAEAKVSSGANLWISAESTLRANASSGGNIFYNGTPSKTDISKSSGGNVIKR